VTQPFSRLNDGRLHERRRPLENLSGRIAHDAALKENDVMAFFIDFFAAFKPGPQDSLVALDCDFPWSTTATISLKH